MHVGEQCTSHWMKTGNSFFIYVFFFLALFYEALKKKKQSFQQTNLTNQPECSWL